MDRSSFSEALQRAESTLNDAGIDGPRVQALALLAHVTGFGRSGVLARLRDLLEPAAAAEFWRLVRLRAAHHPLQYLLGRAGFLDFEVRVGPGVFIPRPETEQLVNTALSLWDPAHRWAVDLCTGSGAIAIALARARPEARIVAIDISPLALTSARASAADVGVVDRILFVRADLLTAVSPTPDWRAALGLLACNPPYARDQDVQQPEVREHEPRLAWEAGPAGTETYARLLRPAALLLAPGRPLVLELGYGQESSVVDLLGAAQAWTKPQVEADFQGIPRVLSTRRQTTT